MYQINYRLQSKYTNCKGVKNNTNFGQILEYKRSWIQHVIEWLEIDYPG
jgi:hypothetical protein